jgi:hypothetical protein
MDRDMINRKLESLRRCIARIESKRPIRPDVLRVNYDLQDIIALNLERAVQTCVDITAHVISQTELPVPSTMVAGVVVCRMVTVGVSSSHWRGSWYTLISQA